MWRGLKYFNVDNFGVLFLLVILASHLKCTLLHHDLLLVLRRLLRYSLEHVKIWVTHSSLASLYG